eukprot:2447617-Pleurochrysis_carterae.AAC.1
MIRKMPSIFSPEDAACWEDFWAMLPESSDDIPVDRPDAVAHGDIARCTHYHPSDNGLVSVQVRTHVHANLVCSLALSRS